MFLVGMACVLHARRLALAARRAVRGEESKKGGKDES